MAEVKINKKDLEKMLKEQLGCSKVIWDKDGNALVDMDLEEIKKQEVKIIEKIREVQPWRPYPIWYTDSGTVPKPINDRGWQITCKNNTITNTDIPEKVNIMTFHTGD